MGRFLRTQRWQSQDAWCGCSLGGSVGSRCCWDVPTLWGFLVTFHEVSTTQVIETPFSPIVKQLNQQPLGEVVLHFFQLQGPDAVGAVDLNRSVFISTAGNLQRKKTGKENKSPEWITKHACMHVRMHACIHEKVLLFPCTCPI